ncbi:WD domain-containing [Pyrenophora seminiperda CCB06]|uniref:WD domain-containing n=1 Tax=Pyrenophora seminiperda CCB06 TaxID=1302712 RepID=A0A3M7M681_9PLEO|nr:WD domain-containing [Pyrenophora seminiperda CCB06]
MFTTRITPFLLTPSKQEKPNNFGLATMKALIIASFNLLGTFVTGLITTPSANFAMPGLSLSSPDWTELLLENSEPTKLSSRADDVERVYHIATCKGQKLLTVTTYPRNVAAAYVSPIDSPWTGPIEHDLTTWGYKLDTDDGTPQWRASHSDECEFATNHKLKTMFDSLSILTRSTWQNGPNRCYFIYHKDGPAIVRDAYRNLPPVNNQWYYVNNRPYRATNAEFTIGVNAMSGMIMMLNRQNPASSAKALWRLPQLPPSDQLPALRSSSDIMWGLWKLENAYHPWDIKRFLSTPITNDDTTDIIEKILEARHLRLESLMVYPGLEFQRNAPEYLPLLGSPNGFAVGYFLAQHKTQLGSKHVSKINVFKADTNAALAICLLFTISNQAGAAQAEQGSEASDVEHIGELMVEKGTKDSEHIVREHVVW